MRGTFTSRATIWLLGMLERLEPAMRMGMSKVFCHGYLQETNVVVSTTAYIYLEPIRKLFFVVLHKERCFCAVAKPYIPQRLL